MPEKVAKSSTKKGAQRSGPKFNARSAGARAMWSGTLTFGLVSLPVYLFPANRSGRTSLRMLGPGGKPLRREYFDPESGKTVSSKKIQRGYPVEDGRYVVVEDEELDALQPEKSRDIQLTRFVEADEIDPIYFERAYFLTPASATTRPYLLLAATMEKTGRAGIASFVMRGKEYLVAILAEGGILRAETLRYADEIRTPEAVGLPAVRSPGEVRRRRFEKAIRALQSKQLDVAELEDEQSQALRQLVERKAKSKENVVEVEVEESGSDEEIPDLMNVLRWSLRRGQAADANTAETAKKTKAEKTEAGPKKASDLAALSKQELYERAQERDIPGRSSMTKEELIAALR